MNWTNIYDWAVAGSLAAAAVYNLPLIYADWLWLWEDLNSEEPNS